MLFPKLGGKLPAINEETDNLHEMEPQVQIRGRQFAFNLLTSLKRRLQPYWSLLLAFQLSNPLSPRQMPESCKVTAKDFCIRAGMSELKARAVVEQLDEQRGAYSRASAATERRIHRNLLFFYAERKQAGPSKYPLCDEYAQLVFSVHIASAVIETYFSKSKYIKNKHRSRLSDTSASASMHLSDCKVINPEALTTDRSSLINPRLAWKINEDDQDDLATKYVGKRVRKQFTVDDEVSAYDGSITHVHFVQDSGQFMMHVSYDDDDSEDYEEYEVKEYLLEDD